MSRPLDPRLLRQAPACRMLLRVLGAQQVVAAVLTVTQAWLVADVIVAIFTHAGSVAGPLTALGIVALARSAMAAAQEWTTARGSLRVRAQLRRATLVAAVRLGPAWVKRQQPGRVATATGPALDALDGYVTRALPALVGATVVPGVVLAAIAWSDWQSGLILLVLLPLVPLFMALVGFTTRRLVARQYATLARLAGQFLDLMRGLTTLRIYGRAAASEATVRRATEAYRKQTVATLRVAFLSGLVLDLLAALSVAVVAVDVGLRLDHGHIAFRTALLVLILAPELFAPLRALGVHHHATEEGLAAAAGALDIIDELPTHDAGQLPGVRPAQVYLDAVSVRYAERPGDALHDVSLALEPCSVTALTGPSGAGKSTLIATLLGFVSPTAGAVYAGAQPLGDRAAWRAGVAWLPQRPRPSQSTVGAEVRLGDPDAPDDVVAAACAQCHAPDPATPLGEDGSAVSAGERRRIALARALVRAEAVRAAGGVPLVLLDEPSEDLDAATASVVASVVDDLRGWATVVVATHNDELAAVADVRAELDDGRIVAVRQQRAARPAVPPEPARPARPAPAPPVTAGAAPYRLRDLVQAAGASRQLAVAAGLSMLSTIAALALLATSMWLISRAAQHPNVQALAVAVVGVRTFAIARGVLRYFERMATHDAALRMLAALRVRVFAALRPLPPQVLGSYGRGDLLRRFVGDVDGAQEGLVRAVVPATGAVAGVVAAVVIAATLAPVAGAALAVAVLVGGLLVPVLAYRIAGDGARSARLVGARERRCAALIDAMDELVAYGRADSVVDDVAGTDAELADAARRPAGAAALGTFGTGVAAGGALVAVLAAAAGAARSGALPVVDVGVLAVCVLAAFEALAALPASWVAWARCRAGLCRVAEITGQSPAFNEPVGDVELPSTAPGLRVRALTLAPAAGVAPVLDTASFDLERSTRLALVGSSGSGKSTLLAAAMRLLPSRRGSISLGTDARAVDLRAMRAADVPPVIAGSLQGDHVFDATLRDNLRVVRPDATDDALDDVASRAGLLGFVDTLPQRWSTPAGADGANLSGGQRQRLLLARALLADPDILVLDEPTAHLDADTEAAVLDDVLDATSDRTVLLTTHRRLAAGRVDAVLEIVDRDLVGATPVLSEAGRTRSAT